MAPVAVAAQAHRLPCRPGLGKGDTPGEAPLGIAAEGGGRMLRAALARSEKVPGLDAAHGGGDALARHDRGLGPCPRTAREHERGERDETSQALRSPSGRTQCSRKRPIAKSPMMGATPRRALSVRVVTSPISAGARNAVARPERP